MLTLNINGKEVKGVKGQTILEIARENGIDIPTLCHDERVKPYGSCGLCVVQMEGSDKLIRSCATEAQDGMVIYTDNSRIRKSRKMTLELLLSDHTGDCRPPCMKACPAGTDCQGYVGLIANGKYREAVELIKEKLPLPASIGLVCPHPCEEACRRQHVEEPVAIAALKAFVGYQDLNSGEPYMPALKPASGKSAAIVGAGPAGLSAAYYLAKEGHKVTIYEAMPEPGGMLRYGIPQYRLPKDLLDQEINLIRDMGVDIVTNIRINEDITVEYLTKNYDAVFLGIGAWQSSRMRCKGEDSPGVIGGIDFLRQVAMHKPVDIGKRVAVVGGGNTAMDAARTAVRLGASEVTVMYRRTRAEMPAEDIEITEAEEENVKFKFLAAPEEILTENGRAAAIRLQKMQLGEPDASGRRRPVPISGEEETIPVDTVIAAIGQQVNTAGFDGIELSKWGTIDANASYMTNIKGVFAGGDAVTGPKIAIQAVAQGRDAALAMIKFLNGEELTAASADFLVEKQVTADDFCHYEKEPRVQLNYLPAEERRNNFAQVAEIMPEEQAIMEAKRCLECGCADYFECKLIKYANDYKVEPQRLEGDKHEKLPIEQHPFMTRDMNKCILCSLCVRVCDEVMGRTALGLVNRGFDTVIKPEFGVPLLDSDCISCGQCIAVCPTGAIVEHNQGIKNVPLQVEQTRTVCPYCDLGCTLLVEHRGSLVSKVIPEEGSLLCSCGRFGWQDSDAKRLTEPMIRKNGRLEKVSWQEAIEYTAGIALDLHTQFGDNSSGVFISPACTMEEAAAAVNIAHNGLKTEIAGSFAADPKKNLTSMLGADLYQNNLDELTDTDLIIMLGSFDINQIAAVKARQAAQDGVQLVIISQEESIADDKAVIKVSPRENNTALLKQILAAAAQRKNYVNSFAGREELERMLSTVVVGEEASTIEAMYASAPKAMIIINGCSTSAEAVTLMADLALMTGHIGAPGNGIIVINNGANSQGIINAGFTADREEMLQKIKQGNIKGLFILGEDPVGAGIITETELQKAGKIIVLDAFMTPTASTADVVLPGAAALEKTGTCTGADGRVRIMDSRLTPPSGMDNLAILNELAQAMQLDASVFNTDNEIISSKIAFYGALNLNDASMFNQEITHYTLRKFIEYKKMKQIK